MTPLPAHILVAVAIFAAVLITGGLVVFGGWIVRWLGLPADPILEAPAPEPVPAGDPAAARARAAAWLEADTRVRRVSALYALAADTDDRAHWIAGRAPDRAETARAASAQAKAAAEASRAAFIAGDVGALADAEVTARTAAERVRALGDGLPDLDEYERRKLVLLASALVVSVLIAVLSLCLR